MSLPSPKKCRIRIEHTEIIEGSLLKLLEQKGIVFVRCPGAQLVPAGPDPALKVRNHASHVVGDDLDVRMAVKKPGEDQVGHGDACLVGPTEDEPDLVMALGLAFVVREVRPAGRMDPDRPIQFGHQVEEGHGFGSGQGPAKDVAEDLDPDCPEVFDGPFCLGKEALRIIHGQGCNETRETIRIFPDQFGHAVIGQFRQVCRNRGSTKGLDRQLREADDLNIIGKLIHDPEPYVQVEDARDRPDPLVHVFATGSKLDHLVEICFWKDVIKDVYLHDSLLWES
jgi:hypothetical protein